MLRRDASALFRCVLLTSTVGTSAVAAACGGAIDTGLSGSSGGEETTGSSSGATSSSSGSTSSSGGATSSSSGSTSSSSGSTSSSSGSTSGGSSSGGGSCVMGTVAASEDFCCPPGTSCTHRAYNDPDAGAACLVDCERVCAAVAPGATGGFLNCSWKNDHELSYGCGSCGVGRVPGGTALCPLGETVAERLARQAYYEAASVIAFERLTVVLESARAPEALLDRARAAARDEARHATLFAELASRHGAAPVAVTYRAATPSLFELAVENATEGCVRETFGALVTLHQASYAGSAEVRAAFAAIAEDEAEHAALSWELKAWFDTRLTAEERAEVQRAHDRALDEARREAAAAPDAPGLALGLPAPERARDMLDTLMAAMAVAA